MSGRRTARNTKKNMPVKKTVTAEVDQEIISIPPVARANVDQYGNTDSYVAADVESSTAEIETAASLAEKDYDNKLPLEMTATQKEELVDFVKDHLILYDKKHAGHLNTNERLAVLYEWAKKQGLNGTYNT